MALWISYFKINAPISWGIPKNIVEQSLTRILCEIEKNKLQFAQSIPHQAQAEECLKVFVGIFTTIKVVY